MIVIDLRTNSNHPPSHTLFRFPLLPASPPFLPPSPFPMPDASQFVTRNIFPISITDGPITSVYSTVYFGRANGGQALALKYSHAGYAENLRSEAEIHSFIRSQNPPLPIAVPQFFGIFRSSFLAEGGAVLVLEDVGDALLSFDELNLEER